MTFLAPALDGRDPLGFLAALGTLRLVSDHLDPTMTLGFDPITGQARFSARSLPDLDACVDAVQAIFDQLGEAVVPGMPADFPPPGAAPDRLRETPDRIAEMATGWASRAEDPVLARRWVRALVTDLATDQQGRAAITRFAAPSGKQSFGTMFTGTKAAVQNRPGALREALLGWHRVAGYTGEYLDHRVLMSSADAPSKADVAERGVPGATWLALMALPLLPATAAGRERTAVGWQRVERGFVWCWPLWAADLRVRPVEVLINHPALSIRRGYSLDESSKARLRRLGVFAAGVASRHRIPARKSDGVLVTREFLTVSEGGKKAPD